jgi:gluconate kinase
MKIASVLLIALLVVLSTATWASQASAAGRDEAISTCIAQAKKQYRQRGRGTAEHRTFLYIACITAVRFVEGQFAS